MPYKVTVTVTQDFDSLDKAEAFGSDVLEKTKGAKFDKTISYYAKPGWYGGSVTVNNFESTVYNPNTENSKLLEIRTLKEKLTNAD